MDNDEARYTKDLLVGWKPEAEGETLREIESTGKEPNTAATMPNPKEGEKLTIRFDSNRDITTQRNSVGYSHDEIIRVVRICVQNKTGSSTVRNCRAYVTQIDQEESSTTVLHDARCLSWENQKDGFEPIDLLTGIEFRADLVVSEKDTPQALASATNTNAHFPVFGKVSSPFVLRVVSRPPYFFRNAGTWIFTVRIGAANAATETMRLRVNRDGTVNGLSAHVESEDQGLRREVLVRSCFDCVSL